VNNDGYFPLTSIVLTAFPVPNFMMCTDFLFNCHQSRQYCIFSAHFVGTFQGPSGYSLDHLIIIEILKIESHKSGKSVVFYWIPDDIDLLGIEAASGAVKEATLHRTLTTDRALRSYIHSFPYRTVLSSWQGEWANTQGNNSAW
jgi:hypothetical protein